jgi:hypothetical protein
MMRRLLSIACLLVAGPLAAQRPASDSARLIVTQRGAPVGSEDFAFRSGSGPEGVTLSFVATTNGGLEPLRVAVTTGQRRLTVRVATAAGEAAREYPGGRQAVVADERVLSLYALLAHVDPGPVTVYGPPPGGRRSGTLEDAGTGPPPGGGLPLRHLTLRSGEDVVQVWLDAAGRLIMVEIPSRDLRAERVTQP